MNKIIIGLKNLDKDTYKIIKYGILFSIFLAIIASGKKNDPKVIFVFFIYYSADASSGALLASNIAACIFSLVSALIG